MKFLHIAFPATIIAAPTIFIYCACIVNLIVGVADVLGRALRTIDKFLAHLFLAFGLGPRFSFSPGFSLGRSHATERHSWLAQRLGFLGVASYGHAPEHFVLGSNLAISPQVTLSF